MITFKEYLTEKLDVLNPKDVSYRVLRQVYKTWDKERYKKLFDESKSWGFLDKKSMRLYFPLSKKKTVRPPNNDVVDLIKSKGYEILDYNRGILQKADSKGKLVTASIQSVLSKYKKELESVYLKDPHHVDVKNNESSVDDYLIVISRHPYDIIGMTSGRAWENVSCMNLKTGAYKHIVPVDVKEGSMVAYLIKATDKDIQEPIGRLTIRPYLADKQQIVLGVSTKGYYYDIDQTTKDLFHRRVTEWVDSVIEKQNLNGIFKLVPGLYKAEAKEFLEIGDFKKFFNNSSDKEIVDLIADEDFRQEHPNILAKLDDIPNSFQMELIRRNAMFIELLLKNKDYIPSEEVQLLAVQKSPGVINNLLRRGIKPPHSVLIEAIKRKFDAFSFIAAIYPEVLTDELIEVAIESDPTVIFLALSSGYKLTEEHVTKAIKLYPPIINRLLKNEKSIPEDVFMEVLPKLFKREDSLTRDSDYILKYIEDASPKVKELLWKLIDFKTEVNVKFNTYKSSYLADRNRDVILDFDLYKYTTVYYPALLPKHQKIIKDFVKKSYDELVKELKEYVEKNPYFAQDNITTSPRVKFAMKLLDDDRIKKIITDGVGKQYNNLNSHEKTKEINDIKDPKAKMDAIKKQAEDIKNAFRNLND